MANWKIPDDEKECVVRMEELRQAMRKIETELGDSKVTVPRGTLKRALARRQSEYGFLKIWLRELRGEDVEKTLADALKSMLDTGRLAPSELLLCRDVSPYFRKIYELE